MDIYTIYKFTNKQNGKAYIGYTQDVEVRIANHHTQSKKKKNKFYNAIKKYGWHNFDFQIIYQSKDQKHCLDVMEPYFIKEYDSYKMGYNSTIGGDSGKGYKHNSKSRNKMAESRGKKFVAKDNFGEIYQITSDDPRFLSGELVGINKGNKPTKETLNKLSKARIGNKNRLGTFHSEEIKKIIAERTSAALKGKTKKTIECPHCKKIGGASNMKRYHFDFCKLIKIQP